MRLRLLWLTLPMLALVFPACDPYQNNEGSGPVVLVDDTTSGDAGPSDSGSIPDDTMEERDTGSVGSDTEGREDTGVDIGGDMGGEDTSGCSGDRVDCSGECVDLATSNQHCGQCGNTCPSGASCENSSCTCPDGQALCDGACVDITANDDHCGGCNNTCSDPRSCANRQCSCPSGGSYCGGECIDTTTHSDHCGGCGNSCGSGEVCKQSSCETQTKVETVVSETNKVRSTQTDCGSEGVKSAAAPLQANEELHEAAQAHADDMAMNDFISHTGSDGSDFSQRIRRTDYTGQPVAENVAAGNSDAAKTVQQWVGSDGHCKNLMLQRATEIGVGVANNPMSTYNWYWVQVFGKK